jgi:hypothetical protein
MWDRTAPRDATPLNFRSMATALFPPSRDITDDYRDVSSPGGSSGTTGFHPLGESLLASPRESVQSTSSLALSGRLSSGLNAGFSRGSNAVEALVKFLDEDEGTEETQSFRKADGKWDLDRVRSAVHRSPAERDRLSPDKLRTSDPQRRPFTSTPPLSRRADSPSIRLDQSLITSPSRSVIEPTADRSQVWRDSPSPQPRDVDVLSLSQAARLNASRPPSGERAIATASLRRRSTSSPPKRDRDLPPRSATFPRRFSPLRDTVDPDKTLRPPSPRPLSVLIPDQSQPIRNSSPDPLSLGTHGRSPSYEPTFAQFQETSPERRGEQRLSPSPSGSRSLLPQPDVVNSTSSMPHVSDDTIAPPVDPNGYLSPSPQQGGGGSRQSERDAEGLEMFNGRTIAEEAQSVREKVILGQSSQFLNSPVIITAGSGRV